ncbi:MAG: segregation/condensation protein A [Oscillospiraceae bacterium]|nr:segregation/condensation protein A [Oscillospiraceae bacterium]
MDNPTFRLEGVVKSSDEMEDFEGPLTLILQLLSKNKIEIKDIKISELLDQYLAYLDEMKAMDLEIASEFVQMASHLVYIKARMLINAGEEPSELEELIESLERLKRRDVYERVKAVCDTLGGMYFRGAGIMTKPPEYFPQDKEYRYVHDRQDILDAMLRVLSREDAVSAVINEPRFTMPSRIIYSVSDKSEEIMIVLIHGGETRVSELFSRSKSRTELVATFISLLELAKAGKIGIIGDGEETTVMLRSEGGE